MYYCILMTPCHEKMLVLRYVLKKPEPPPRKISTLPEKVSTTPENC